MIMLYSCGTDEKENFQIQPPLKNVKVEFDTLQMDASEAKTFSFETGTTINVPKDAFVDENGNPIKGKVELKFREFHNAAQIIASGVPMVYDSAGIKKPFESAGMFDIRGFKDGKPVFIANDKNIEVNLASYTSDSTYNDYYYEEENTQLADNNFSLPFVTKAYAQDNIVKRGWKFIQKSILKRNIAKEENKAKEEKLASLNKQFFKLQYDTVKYPEFSFLKDFYFELPENIENKFNPLLQENEWVLDEKWQSINIADGAFNLDYLLDEELTNYFNAAWFVDFSTNGNINILGADENYIDDCDSNNFLGLHKLILNKERNIIANICGYQSFDCEYEMLKPKVEGCNKVNYNLLKAEFLKYQFAKGISNGYGNITKLSANGITLEMNNIQREGLSVFKDYYILFDGENYAGVNAFFDIKNKNAFVSADKRYVVVMKNGGSSYSKSKFHYKNYLVIYTSLYLGKDNYLLILKNHNKKFVAKINYKGDIKFLNNLKTFAVKANTKFENDIVKEETSRFNKEADYLRTFEVNNFGIYNCDRLYYDYANLTVCNFNIDCGIVNTDYNNIKLFQITGSRQTTILTYQYSDKIEFRYDPKEKNQILAILPDDKIAHFSCEDFEKIKNSLSKDKSFTIKMKVLPEVNSVEILANILDSKVVASVN